MGSGPEGKFEVLAAVGACRRDRVQIGTIASSGARAAERPLAGGPRWVTPGITFRCCWSWRRGAPLAEESFSVAGPKEEDELVQVSAEGVPVVGGGPTKEARLSVRTCFWLPDSQSVRKVVARCHGPLPRGLPALPGWGAGCGAAGR